MNKRFIALILLLSIGLTTPATALSTQVAEVDVTATVYKVVDGDTLDAFPVGRVRLADIDAPELGEPGGREAKDALTKLVLKVKVHLDVDDFGVMDKYNRLICVVYIRHNDTHLLNVNKWLVDEGHAEIKDYENEFDPRKWTLYVYYPIEEFVSKAEYDKLKAEFDKLKDKYDDLEIRYKELTIKYEALRAEYEKLIVAHKELVAKYEKLKAAYEELKAKYDPELAAKYEKLKTEYDELKLNYERLRSAYEELSEAFGILHSNYEKAKSDLMMISTYGAIVTVVLLAVGAMIVRRRLAVRKRLKPVG